MNPGLDYGASALNALQKWQDVTALNISSNVYTGHKQQVVAFEAAGGTKDASFDNVMQAVTPKAVVTTDFAPGKVIPTGNPTDIGITSAKGFFKLETPGGDVVYSRDGEFHFNQDYTLVNKQGYIVQANGGAIVKNPNKGEISINPDGKVYQGKTLINQLTLYDFNDKAALIKVNGGYSFPPDKPVPEEAVEKPTFLQGALEHSNSNPIMEMVALIQVSRAMESNITAMKSLDEQMGRGIQFLNPMG